MRRADPVASRRDAMRLPRDRTYTPKALQKLAGGKRSATTGCVAPIQLHPEGMPAVNPRISGHMQHPLDSTAR
jgi:hypothetical protein